MSEWKEYKLGDCVEAIIDNRGKSAPTNQNGEYPLLEINSIGGYYPNYGVVRKYVDETTFKTWFRSGHPASGDILIPTVGTIGILSIMDNKNACIAQNIIALRIKKDVSNVFIYYYLKGPIVKQELLNLDIGGVQPSIKVPHLLNLSITLPPKEAQIIIAAILSSLDDKIDLLRRENATLEQMAETLFRQWFVVEAKEEWEEGKLTDYIKLMGGGTPKTAEESYWNGNVCWLSGGDIANNHKGFVSDSEKHISEIGLNNSAAKLLPENALVVSARGTVGKYCLLSKPMAFSQSNYGILPMFEDCYFFTYLLVAYNIDELQSAAYGSVFDTITTKTFDGVIVTLPQNREEIVSFEKKVSPYFEKIKKNQQQIQTLIQTRDGLLPRLMSGECKIL